MSAEIPSVATVPAEAIVWHFFDSRKTQRGPVSGTDLLWFFASGEVTQETYCWRNGLADWAALTTIADLTPMLSALSAVGAEPWFYMDSMRIKQGPFARDDIKGFRAAGMIGDETLVWTKAVVGTSYNNQLDTDATTSHFFPHVKSNKKKTNCFAHYFSFYTTNTCIYF